MILKSEPTIDLLIEYLSNIQMNQITKAFQLCLLYCQSAQCLFQLDNFILQFLFIIHFHMMFQQLYQITADQDTLFTLKQSLAHLNSQSLDGKQSFDEQFKIFKQATQTLQKVISNHRGRIEFAKTRMMQRREQMKQKQAMIGQMRVMIGKNVKQIEELKDNVTGAQAKFKDLYAKFDRMREECKQMESSIDHIEFSFLDEENEIQFREFSDYFNSILIQDSERPISVELTSLQSVDYQGRERREDFNLRIAQQNMQKMRENMKKTRRMLISGICSGILRDILTKIKNSDGITEQQIVQMTSTEQIYAKVDKQMDERMGMNKNKPALEKYLLTHPEALSNSLLNSESNRINTTSQFKRDRKYSENLKKIIAS